MSSTATKLLALCLAWLLLLAPFAHAMAAPVSPVPMQGHAMHDMQMESDKGTNHCAGCPSQLKVKHKSCCQGAGCALSGGCAACVAAFYTVRIPVRVALNGSPVGGQVAFSSSHDPELFLRPPRA